jgi:cytoskeleton protein RodZ
MTEQIQQQELLAAVGQKLKAAREAQGITLQEVSSRTRIQNAFLEKIEQGELEGLPGFSFVRGFIRNYAQMLGIDDPELLEQLQAMGRVAQATPPPPMKSSTERLLDAEHGAGLPWPRLVLLALLTILLLWVGYLLVRVFLPSDAAYEAPPAKAPVVQAPAAARPAAPIPAATPAPAPAVGAGVASAPAGRTAAPPSALRVTVRGLEDTWVRYALDRKPPMEILMHPAESATLDADDEVRLTIGKSQGVSVYLNGEEVVLPAERDRLVADLVLNKLTVLKIRN